MKKLLNWLTNDANWLNIVLMLVAVGTVLGVLSTINRSLFYIALFALVILCFVLLAGSTIKMTLRVCFYLLSAFVLLHFLVFPFIYTSLLRSDINSIRIDNQVLLNEKSDAVNELERSYSSTSSVKYSKILLDILNSHDSILDTSISFLRNNNIVILESYLIARIDSIIKIQRAEGPPTIYYYDCILICDNKGHKIIKLFDEVQKSFITQGSVRDFLSALKRAYDNKLTSFSQRKANIDQGKELWSYERILPYSINIFNTDNFKPISGKANTVHFFHNVFVWILIVPMIIALLIELISVNIRQISKAS